MIRFLLRVVGVALLAGAFASAVIDGTRSIAANALLLTPFGDACAYLFPKSFPHWRSFVEQHVGAWAWDPTLIRFFQFPTFLVLTVFGIICMWASKKRPPPIGYSSRP